MAVASPEAPIAALADHPADAVVVVALSVVAVLLLHAAFVELPRTLHAVADAGRSRTPTTHP